MVPVIWEDANGFSANGACASSKTEKSTLWTDAGVDQNFQRDLGVIGPLNFKGNSYNDPSALFSGKFIWTNAP